jgi:molybdenum cofactor cytidylyltransferase
MDALILSAGKASRFGLPKFLLPAGEGYTLLTRSIENALVAIGGKIVVVLGRDAWLARADIQSWLWPENAARVHMVENPTFEQGLSTSVKVGVTALRNSSSALILLADQPAVSAQQLGQLVNRFDPQLWAVSAGELGEPKPPMILGKELLDQVDVLSGDQGFKLLLKQNVERIQQLEWGSGHWATDVDTWEVYYELALELGWHKEDFEPLEKPPAPDQLGQWLDSQKLEPTAYLEQLRRAVLTLLNTRPRGH